MAFFGFTAVIAVICASQLRTASGHVQPSVSTNNRYIKLTAFADRARLAYIVYIGEIPGQTARVRLDADRDGVLSDAETATFRDEWARRVRDGLSVESDGAAIPITWDSAHVGLGDPRTSSGAFSLDLVAWLCVPAASLRLVDTVVIPEAGESEVLIEESPGVEITGAELAGNAGTKHTWKGEAHPINKGLSISWRAAADAPPPPGNCGAPPARRSRWWLPLLISGAALIGMFAILIVWRKRTRR
jgi:hypothetical protein